MLIYLTPYCVELKTFYSLSTLYRNSARSVFRYIRHKMAESGIQIAVVQCLSIMPMHTLFVYDIFKINNSMLRRKELEHNYIVSNDCQH